MTAKTMKELYEYALTFWNEPYVWGGEMTAARPGVDCSGLVQLILAKANLDPKGDQTAHGLYWHFREKGKFGIWGLGALSFYGSEDRVHHVGWCIDERLMLNAAGGDSRCLNPTIARKTGASVKIEPILSHKHFLGVIMPKYDFPK